MNTAPDFAKLYINWLKKKIVLKDMGDYQEITTPFLDKNNDHMQIFVKPHSDGQCILSDAGSTINELALSGVTINTQKRRELLNFIINKHGISFDPATETLYSVTDIKDFAHKKHALLQAMLAVDDMFMVAQSRISSLFEEDVANLFTAWDIRYSRDISFFGRSGFNHSFDFIIPSSRQESERVIRTINNATKDRVQTIIFAWEDVKEDRKVDSVMFAIINDSSKAPSKAAIAAFQKYNILPMRWSEIGDYKQQLSA